MARITLVILICTLFSCALAASFPFDAQAVSIPRCQQPPLSGLCLAYFPRFFFNATTGKCHNFVFGGCQGNENNFFTEEECLKACGGGNTEEAPKPETEALDENNVIVASAVAQASGSQAVAQSGSQEVARTDEQNVCSLPQEPGLCYALFEKYYFNGEKCEAFNYGGCGGNKNNFETEEECNKACPPKTQRK